MLVSILHRARRRPLRVPIGVTKIGHEPLRWPRKIYCMGKTMSTRFPKMTVSSSLLIHPFPPTVSFYADHPIPPPHNAAVALATPRQMARSNAVARLPLRRPPAALYCTETSLHRHDSCCCLHGTHHHNRLNLSHHHHQQQQHPQQCRNRYGILHEKRTTCTHPSRESRPQCRTCTSCSGTRAAPLLDTRPAF